MVFSLCVHIYVQNSSLIFIKTSVVWDEGPTLIQYDLILTRCIYNDLFSKQGHILRYWGGGEVRTSTYEI